MGKQLRKCIPAALLVLLPLCGSEPDPNGPVIRNIVQDFTNGTVDFDMVNAGTQDVSAWKVVITFYDADGKIAGTHGESQGHHDADEMLKPGASKHFAWGLAKLEGGVWPARISVDVNACVPADNTACGDEAGIREFVKDRNAALRISRRLPELLEEVAATADPRGTIKRELQNLPPHDAVSLPEREFRYALSQADETLQSKHPKVFQKLVDYMREWVSRTERNAQIVRGEPATPPQTSLPPSGN
jgi:hypothetical protein